MYSKLVKLVLDSLEELKGRDIKVLDVSDLTDITDTLVVTSATSSRHLKSLANHVVEQGKKSGFQPIGVEGMDSSDWVLVDFGDAVVHIMLPETRQFYELEKLWSVRPDSNTPGDSR